MRSSLKLAPLLFQRIGELRHMKLADLDFERSEWRYFVTKTKIQHIVTLHSHAVAIIETLRQLSEDAINSTFHNTGYDTHAGIAGHCFRAIAPIFGGQELRVDPKPIERKHAHAVSNRLGTAYEHVQFLKCRKLMMQRWTYYLDFLNNGAKIILI